MLIVTAFKDSSIVRRSVTNPDFGSIQVKDNSMKLVNGFLTKNNSPAFIRGKYDDLQAMNLKNGQNLATVLGNKKLIVKEQTTPFYEGQQPKVNPTSGAIVTSNGNPIYRQTELVDENSTECDVLMKMDSVSVGATVDNPGEEIKR